MKLKKRNGIYYADLRSIGKGRVSLRTGDIEQARAAFKLAVEGVVAQKTHKFSLSMALQRAEVDYYRLWKPKGIVAHRSTLNLIGEELGPIHLNELTAVRLTAWRDNLQSTGMRNATVNKRFSYLKRVCQLCVEWGWLEYLPNFPSRLPESQYRHRELSLYEEEYIIREFRLDRMLWMQNLVEFLVDTGVRLGEAFAIQPEERVEALNTGILYIPDSKNGGDRHVPLTDRAQAALSGAGWLFFTKRQAQYQWDIVRGMLGLTEDAGFVLHSLRHTCASRLLQEGIGLATVSQWLGHSSVTMTQKYAKVSMDNLLEARAVLGR